MIFPPSQICFTQNINQIIFSLGYEKLGHFWIIFNKMSRLKLHGRFIYYLHLPDQLIFFSTKLNDGKNPSLLLLIRIPLKGCLCSLYVTKAMY
jgi:hypothetical protein